MTISLVLQIDSSLGTLGMGFKAYKSVLFLYKQQAAAMAEIEYASLPQIEQRTSLKAMY